MADLLGWGTRELTGKRSRKITDNDSNDPKKSCDANRMTKGMSLGAGIGVALGAGIGTAMGSIALGAGVGVALGTAIGMTIAMMKGK